MRRSKFSLSHKVSFSCDQGELIPCSLVEVLPGDMFRHSTSLLIRLAPMLAPVFTQLNATIWQFFVPSRIVMDDFEDFITGGPNGDNQTVWPTISFASPVAVGSLADYLGVPPGFTYTGDKSVNALPFRMYNKIWNEWMRDQDLQTELVISNASGNDTTTNTTLQNVCWEKDYFTSARPFEQKGPQVTIPIGTEAPVKGLSTSMGLFNSNPGGTFWDSEGNNPPLGNNWQTPSAIGQLALQGVPGDGPRLIADLSAVTGIPVTELRLALALQRFEEISARYGSRYVEYIMSRFGVRSSDARLQRPELLSTSKQVVQIAEVLQTAEGDDPVGELRGHGIGAMRSNRYMKHFEEHGYVMTLFAVQPRTMYPQGLRRTWNRRDKYDFFQPETAHIGQQEILNKEVYAGSATPQGIFGWQDRYDEYRREESRVAGEFRTSQLDYWHQARIFSSEPALNAAFVSSNPTERIFAVPSEDVLYVNANHSIQARRAVPRFASSFIR